MSYPPPANTGTIDAPALWLRQDGLSERALSRIAVALSGIVLPGDCILLEGELGAGKSSFARALIRAILTTDEDIPSPTFTIVQTYETIRGPLWHADLYRIGGEDELIELGLYDALETTITLIEWPQKLALPQSAIALRVCLSYGATPMERNAGFQTPHARIAHILRQALP